MAEFKRFDSDAPSNTGGAVRGNAGETAAGTDESPRGNTKITVRSSTGKLFVDYRDTEELRRFLTPNGKVQGRKKTGLNAREQRLVAQAVKRARYMALLPFTSATM